MKIIQVIPSIESTGGPSYTVPLLCDAMAALGWDVSLHALKPFTKQPPKYTKLHLHEAWPILPNLGISPRMQFALAREAKTANIMHNHSLWMLPNVYPGWATKPGPCKLVVSPRGTLSDWALNRSQRQKKVFWHLLQKQVFDRAACIHATSTQEYEYVRKTGYGGPVMLLPNPIEVPAKWKDNTPSTDTSTRKRLLFLARIHPVKGVDMLLDAWAQLEADFPDWQLDIVGPDNGGYLDKMKERSQQRQLTRVTFVGEVAGEAKEQVYRQASLYVLPTHTENFGVTVAEALARGIPAITTFGAPWEGLHHKRCGWWIPIGVEPLVASLQEALATPTEILRDMGSRGRAWMFEDFSPEVLAKRTIEAYRWLSYGGIAPQHIQLH